ncbi:3794_t:CDS:2, partial [Cetraspora pellucida]
QACDFELFCFEVDKKYDLNSDDAPVLSLVIEDNAGYKTPIIDCFIDDGQLPSINNYLGVKPMTTNNLMEQMNKSIK